MVARRHLRADDVLAHDIIFEIEAGAASGVYCPARRRRSILSSNVLCGENDEKKIKLGARSDLTPRNHRKQLASPTVFHSHKHPRQERFGVESVGGGVVNGVASSIATSSPRES